jgi:hypothetical protein
MIGKETIVIDILSWNLLGGEAEENHQTLL